VPLHVLLIKALAGSETDVSAAAKTAINRVRNMKYDLLD